MNDALTLWGFTVSGHDALIGIALYLALSILFIITIPRWSVPLEKDTAGKPVQLTVEARTKLIDARAKIRAAVIQVIGGVTVLAGFISTLQSIRGNEDQFNKTKADLFALHMKTLATAGAKPEDLTQAMYILSYVARSDRSYHRVVFDSLASFVTERSAAACKDENYRSEGYARDHTIQLAMRIIGERKPADDPTGKRLNLERSCLVGLELLDEWGVVKGLSKARLSESKMLRIDFGRAELPGAQLMGIKATDSLNPGWETKIGRRLHAGAEGDPREGTWDGSERRRYVAHFIEAMLENADFSGARLEGADFSGARLKGAKFDGAVISRTSFKGVQDLTADQLKYTCVGRPEMADDEIELEQPYFFAALRAEIKSHPILKGRIPKCA
jgi:uncharacterized protein YjbI with pentapeptide repeats